MFAEVGAVIWGETAIDTTFPSWHLRCSGLASRSARPGHVVPPGFKAALPHLRTMSSNDEMLSALLDYIHEQRGVDFRDYKPTTLGRCLGKRLQATGAKDYGEYLDLLQASPDELVPLLDTLFINVTSFFRDPETWAVLRSKLEERVDPASDRPIRVWCAGVASGEEGYTVAMILSELLGMDAVRERVKIYATDVDEDALARARQALYTGSQVEAIPQELRERYLERRGDVFTFGGELRRALIFGRHDLLQDAPISKLDLLVCRNTLMYFNRPAQDRILARFHFALAPSALLLLGSAEMMLSRRHLFEPVDSSVRLFEKTNDLSLQDRLDLMAAEEKVEGGREVAEQVKLRDLAYRASPVAQIPVDSAGNLAVVNDAAREQFGITPHDVGRPFQDVEISYRPVEIRSHIEQVFEDGDAIRLDAIPRPLAGGGVAYLNIDIKAVYDQPPGEQPSGVSITFTDVSRIHELNMQLADSRREVETAYEELQSTNEELETTNEELQSTIEELETTNEELQSTNEEMAAVNQELQERSVDPARLHAYMRSVLDSVRAAIVVLDESSRVQMWNDQAEELWGLRRAEVENQPFLRLDIGLPVEELSRQIRASLRGEETDEQVVEGHNRRGRPIRCRVAASPLNGPGESISGAIILVERLHAGVRS